MSPEIQIDLSEWKRFALQMGESAGLLDAHMRNAMEGSLDWLLEQIIARTPVNLGLLRGSFAREIYGTAYHMEGIAGTAMIYGLPVEMGRDPGRPPPADAIKLWARRKLGLSGAELDQAAFAIARHIGRHGTTGALMVEQAFARAAQAGSEIDRIWEYELEQFLAEMAR